MFFDKWFKRPKVKESKFACVLADLNAIKINSLKSVFSSDMSIFQVHCYRNSITEYCILLETLINAFKYERVLYPKDFPTIVEMVYIRDFYIDSNRRCVDPVSTTEIFIDVAISFLNIFDEKEQLSDKTFTIEKNLLLTQYIVSNIHTLAKELKELSNGGPQGAD